MGDPPSGTGYDGHMVIVCGIFLITLATPPLHPLASGVALPGHTLVINATESSLMRNMTCSFIAGKNIVITEQDMTR